MKNVEETKAILNKLIKEDKKHIKFFEDKFEEFEKAKMFNANLYFIIENKYYVVKKYHEVKYDWEKSFQNTEKEIIEKPSFTTYLFRSLNSFLNYEDNNCTSWIAENFEYLKNRIQGIYEKNKTCHIYQFKYVERVRDNSYNQYVRL